MASLLNQFHIHKMYVTNVMDIIPSLYLNSCNHVSRAVRSHDDKAGNCYCLPTATACLPNLLPTTTACLPLLPAYCYCPPTTCYGLPTATTCLLLLPSTCYGLPTATACLRLLLPAATACLPLLPPSYCRYCSPFRPRCLCHHCCYCLPCRPYRYCRYCCYCYCRCRPERAPVGGGRASPLRRARAEVPPGSSAASALLPPCCGPATCWAWAAWTGPPWLARPPVRWGVLGLMTR